jgi:hypothetical protein
MDIIDFEGNLSPKLVSRISKSTPKFSGTADGSGNVSLFLDNENPYGILSTAISEKYIYALFSGKRFDDPLALQSDQILVYTWDGAPVKILKLQNEISEIAVDLEDSYIIGFQDIKDPVLIRYAIK